MIELGRHHLVLPVHCLIACVAIPLAANVTVHGRSVNEIHPDAIRQIQSNVPGAWAGQIPTSADKPSEKLQTKPISVEVNLVLVPVTVTDGSNRPVIGLHKNSFELLDAGRQQKIQFFSLEDEPLSVALVLDVSTSMVNRMSVERDALARFFENANPDDEYFAIGISTVPILLAGSSRGVGQIQSKLAVIEPSGLTALLDSIYLALGKLKSARHQRKVILIISDGGENASRFNSREIRDLVQESDALVYAIRPVEAVPVFRTIEEKLGSHLLTGITEASGGRTVSLGYSDNIAGAAAAISRELRSQYVLGYHPPENPHRSKLHKITVRILTSKHSTFLRAHYRKQYAMPIQ